MERHNSTLSSLSLIMSSRTFPKTSHSLVVQHYIQDAVTLDGPDATFALKTNKLPLIHELPGDSVLVQTLYLSNDPAQRLWIQKGSTHDREDMVALPLGKPMKAFTVSKVLAVGTERQEGDEPLEEGDLVLATGGWSDYTVLKKAAVTKVSCVVDICRVLEAFVTKVLLKQRFTRTEP